jgi:hypothetical protein
MTAEHLELDDKRQSQFFCLFGFNVPFYTRLVCFICPWSLLNAGKTEMQRTAMYLIR